MNPNPVTDANPRGQRFSGSSWVVMAAGVLLAVLTMAASPAGGFAPRQDSPPVLEIDDGLTDEEREFINRPISELTEQEKKRRDEILNKMKEHLLKIMEQREKEKKQEKKADTKRPVIRPPRRPSREPVQQPKKETPPRRTPPRPRKMFTPPSGEPPEEPEGNELLPFDERLYSFGLKNGNYLDLVEMFSRKTALPVLGMPVKLVEHDPESILITYISAELTDFLTTLHQINDLLFYEVIPPLYLYYDADEHRLELDAFKELRFKLPPSRLFASLEALDQAVEREGLMGSVIVRVFFTPKSAMKLFNEIVSGMFGEWVLMSVVADTGFVDYTGRIDTLRQIRDYLERLTPITDVEGELHEIPVEHIKPSEALGILTQLVENIETVLSASTPRPRTPRRPRGGKGTELVLEGERVLVIADDAYKVLLVKGLPYKVNEIKKVLDKIDRPKPEDPREMPVVVELKHAQAEPTAEILDQIVNTGRRQRATPKGRKKGTPLKIVGMGDDQLRIIPDLRSNALILQGPEELISLARDIIDRYLDVETETNFRKVDIEYGNPDVIAGKVESLLTARVKGKGGVGSLKIEVSGNALIMKGDQAKMSEAEQLIKQFDVPDAEKKSTFVAHLENARPSDVVDFLRIRDASRLEPFSKGKRKARASQVGKFFADDASGTVFFYGTEREWENDILPDIKIWDNEIKPEHLGVDFVEVKHADPHGVVSSLNLIYKTGGRKDKTAGARFAPTPRGVIISGSVSGAEIKTIREIIERMDTDPSDPEAFERRTFKLTHAEPEDVEDAILTMFGGGVPGGGGRRPKGAPAAKRGDIRIALTFGGLIVHAPKEKMEEIASLVAVVDSPAAVTFVDRNFVLQNADPAAVEQAIHNLYGKSPGPKGKRRPGQAGVMGKDTIRTSTSAKGIFVFAAEEKMPQIEELIKTMDQQSGVDPIVTRRFDLAGADAEVVAERLEPILQIKMTEMYPLRPGDKGKGRGGPATLSVQASKRTSSLLITAPLGIVEHAKEILPHIVFDEASVQTVLEIYECVNATADDLADLLSAMYGGGGGIKLPRPKGRSKRPGARAGRDRILRRLTGSGPENVEILALPGNKAISVSGTRETVDEVLARARELDEKSTPEEEGKVARTFTLQYADVDTVADAILEMLDKPARKAPARRASDSLDLWDFEPGPRSAAEISVWPRYETGTLMVVAPPDKMLDIEAFIQECERIESPEFEEGTPVVEPYEFYFTEYLSASEVLSLTRTLIDAIYRIAPPIELDYLNKDTVVIKGSPKHFAQIRKLITEYVDTEEQASKVGTVTSVAKIGIENVPPEQVLQMMREFLPGIELELQQQPVGVETNSIPEID